VRAYARLPSDRIFALGLRTWLRHSLQIHAVAALCLGPLALTAKSGDPFRESRILGLFGLYPTAWAVSMDLVEPAADIEGDVILSYFAQFAATVILVRQAHRALAGRAPRGGPIAILRVAILAIGSLLVFAALDGLVAAASECSSALPVLIFIAITVAEAFLAATFWLALPAVAVDGHGVFSALSRGRALAHGSGFRVFALILVPFFLQWIMVLPFGLLVNALEGHALSKLVFAVPAILLVTLKACVLAAAHHEACLRKEGPRADEIGSIFA